jgi:hypothetical protein
MNAVTDPYKDMDARSFSFRLCQTYTGEWLKVYGNATILSNGTLAASVEDIYNLSRKQYSSPINKLVMTLNIIAYNPITGNHEALDAAGNLRIVDLMINLSEKDTDPVALVGKRVEVESMLTYSEIARNVKVLTA